MRLWRGCGRDGMAAGWPDVMTDFERYKLACEIEAWLGAPWNGCGKVSVDFPELNRLFKQINQTKEVLPYAYSGRIYRIHCPHSGLAVNIDASLEYVFGRIWSDGSCSILPITQYDGRLASFSKSPDFTTLAYYKVCPTKKAVFLVSDTGSQMGIDVMALLSYLGVEKSRFLGEREVIFPITRNTVVKEYHCTPNCFKYYMRGKM